MVLSHSDFVKVEENKYLKEKNDAIKDSLTFDFPILFKSNSYATREEENASGVPSKLLSIPTASSLLRSSSSRRGKPTEQITLSWENVNVYKKNEFKLRNFFKRRKTNDSYLMHKDELSYLNQTSTVKTISFTKNVGENQSLESLSSTASTTSSASSSSRKYESNQILFNGSFEFISMRLFC